MDVNTIWHARIAEALSRYLPVWGVQPLRFLSKRPNTVLNEGYLKPLPVALPPGWASLSASVGQRILARQILSTADRAPICVFLTSPAYVALAKLLRDKAFLVYYCADDYRSYAHWGGVRVAEREKELLKMCEHSIFVSEALRCRAILEYGLREQQTSVSMNATEPRFLYADGGGVAVAPDLDRRASVGVIGWVNERIDITLLERVAALSEVKSLTIVGSISSSAAKAAETLLNNPKCEIKGPVLHNEMHEWSRSFDIALIPYNMTEINYYCSPMRLFDHLASGASIIATPACDQIEGFTEAVTIASGETFVEAVRQAALKTKRSVANIERVRENHLWATRAELLASLIRARMGTQ